MKAVLCKEYGGPEKLVVEEIDDLHPGKGQVLINVKACGVNFPDALLIQNLYQFKPDLPFSPGGEVAGIVAEVGEGDAGETVLAVAVVLLGDGIAAGEGVGLTMLNATDLDL